ncbi:WD40/YVTN/BNR-like repeat-containing protein [Pseudoduganella sp. R-31]|uniref:WD40/YVTN/BNR-like repeat-containing protein n=1 Tax=Pseudoduganella sp. R-31 TaxID=3404060 RepID=UPI003CE8EC32
MLRAIPCAVLAALAGCSALPPVAESPAPVRAAAWVPQQHAATTELRGLSVLSDKVAWASGAKGTVLRTVDGEHWTLLAVPGAEAFDFRDIEAFDANTAIVLGAGPGAASRMYRTRDGGASWQLLIVNKDAEGFWDAMAFWDARNGIVFGDPVRGVFQILVTSDGGESWQPVSDPGGLAALPQEGAFAASGTCLSVGGRADAWFVTGGGAQSRVFRSVDRGQSWQAATLQIPAAATSKGAFSVGFAGNGRGIVAGGDYKEPSLETLNGAISLDGGAGWSPAQILPAGFMSAVVPVPGTSSTFVAVGLAGSGYTRDGGKSWTIIEKETKLNAVGFSASGAGWAVGPKGLIVKYVGPPLR